MINEMKSESQDRPDAVVRPLLTSYDSGYEHSLEHWIEVQHLVNEAEGGFLPLTFAAHRSTGGGMKPKVLFLCTGNSARSQMAEGYLRHVASDRFEAMSAGIEPKGLNPLAVEAMEEIGIDISHQTSKDVAQPSRAAHPVCRHRLRQRKGAMPDLPRRMEVPALEPRRPGCCSGYPRTAAGGLPASARPNRRAYRAGVCRG